MNLVSKYLFTISLTVLSLGAVAQVSQNAPFKLFFEKTYLHTDREQYAGGEDIWFKAYLVNAQDNLLFSSSNNLYVELIDPEAKITDRKVIRMEKGLGNGDFKLADSIPPGTWRIRAYTNWMRNFGDNFLFEKRIQVFSTAAKMKSDWITRSRYKGVNRKFDKPDTSIDTSLVEKTVRFFPEGGSLTGDVKSRVAFKTDDGFGNSPGVKGTIESRSGEVIASIDEKSGRGSFYITPSPAVKYIAKLVFSDGDSLVTQLPGTLLSGLNLAVNKKDSILNITVTTNPATMTSIGGKSAKIVIRSKGKTVSIKTVPVSALSQSVSISTDSLPAGINEITLSDQLGRPQAERLVYVEEKDPILLSIKSDKPVYGPKEQVRLDITAVHKSGLPAKASLSLAVTDAGLTRENDGDIRSYLGLQSEVRGKIDSAQKYVDLNNPRRKEQLDLLLLTQGWRDFTWKRVADSLVRISYALEQGMSVSGRVRRTLYNKPMQGITINMRTYSVKGRRMANATSPLYYASTDSLGRFYMDKIEMYGRQLVKVFSVKEKAKKAGLLEQDSVIVAPPALGRLLTRQPTDYLLKDFKKDSAIVAFHESTKKKISLSDTLKLNTVTINSYNYHTIRNTYNYKIEERFKKSYGNVKEFLFGEFKEAYLYGENNDMAVGTIFTMSGAMPRPISFVVNGTIRNPASGNMAAILTVLMDKVETIKCEVYVDRKGVGGKVYLTVKPDALEGDLNVKYFYVNGYYEAREFFAPKYEAPSDTPDKRVTIHWEPSITTDEQGKATLKYYNADARTKVRIAAEGMSADGKAVTGAALYDVR